jgi:hypothetical protein
MLTPLMSSLGAKNPLPVRRFQAAKTAPAHHEFRA